MTSHGLGWWEEKSLLAIMLLEQEALASGHSPAKSLPTIPAPTPGLKFSVLPKRKRPMPEEAELRRSNENDFPSSLGEAQRIIGLSLGKIQVGRSRRGGLSLHRHLLVEHVLDKVRGFYMQETVYLSIYKLKPIDAPPALDKITEEEQ